LFLDEIADLPLAMQVKLLRVIQEKSIRAVGAQQEEPIDVRIISASHKDLESMVAEGTFRQDLYYRINVIGITVPLLSERAKDIQQLADYLIEKHNYLNSSNASISDAALTALKDYSFPGNVRELENILERALALCENGSIEAGDLQLPEVATDNDERNPSLGEMTQNMEKEHILSALEDNRWNQSATARVLGLTLRQLRYRIDKLNLKNQ
jgi:two-component system response regulator PilR (NtrC family)